MQHLGYTHQIGCAFLRGKNDIFVKMKTENGGFFDR